MPGQVEEDAWEARLDSPLSLWTDDLKPHVHGPGYDCLSEMVSRLHWHSGLSAQPIATDSNLVVVVVALTKKQAKEQRTGLDSELTRLVFRTIRMIPASCLGGKHKKASTAVRIS